MLTVKLFWLDNSNVWAFFPMRPFFDGSRHKFSIRHTFRCVGLCVFVYIFTVNDLREWRANDKKDWNYYDDDWRAGEKLFFHVLTIAKSLMMMRNDETLSSSFGEMRNPKKQHLITSPGKRAMRAEVEEKVLIELHGA